MILELPFTEIKQEESALKSRSSFLLALHLRCYLGFLSGGILITPMPGSTPTKPSSATLPFFGVEPEIVDEKGEPLKGECNGGLVIKKPHPGICRTVYGDHKRYEET